MVHLHYILWKPNSPRFDLRSEELITKAKQLQKAGMVAGAEVQCDMSDILDYFGEYTTNGTQTKIKMGIPYQSPSYQQTKKNIQQH